MLVRTSRASFCVTPSFKDLTSLSWVVNFLSLTSKWLQFRMFHLSFIFTIIGLYYNTFSFSFSYIWKFLHSATRLPFQSDPKSVSLWSLTIYINIVFQAFPKCSLRFFCLFFDISIFWRSFIYNVFHHALLNIYLRVLASTILNSCFVLIRPGQPKLHHGGLKFSKDWTYIRIIYFSKSDLTTNFVLIDWLIFVSD